MRFQKLAGVGLFVLHNLFRRARRDELPATRAAFGAQVHDVIGARDQIQIMLDHQNRVALSCDDVKIFYRALDKICPPCRIQGESE